MGYTVTAFNGTTHSFLESNIQRAIQAFIELTGLSLMDIKKVEAR